MRRFCTMMPYVADVPHNSGVMPGMSDLSVICARALPTPAGLVACVFRKVRSYLAAMGGPELL